MTEERIVEKRKIIEFESGTECVQIVRLNVVWIEVLQVVVEHWNQRPNVHVVASLHCSKEVRHGFFVFVKH